MTSYGGEATRTAFSGLGRRARKGRSVAIVSPGRGAPLLPPPPRSDTCLVPCQACLRFRGRLSGREVASAREETDEGLGEGVHDRAGDGARRAGDGGDRRRREGHRDGEEGGREEEGPQHEEAQGRRGP